jgi:adenosylcobinamide-GDP ribazoletransferase
MKSLWLAIGFLTLFPVEAGETQPGDLGRAAMWFPLVGLAIGGLLAAAHYGLSLLFQPLLAAALVVTLWAAITGGLHLDGLADCCDGLLAAVSRERRLEIMRDPRLGAFGGAGLALFLILKVLALASASSRPPLTTAWLLLFAPCLARWLILIVGLQPTARPGGMGAGFSAGLDSRHLLLAAVFPAVLIAATPVRALAAAGVAHGIMLGVIGLARSRLGGVTGDVYGLTVELGELGVLLAFAASVA